jgi:hypothetical protein
MATEKGFYICNENMKNHNTDILMIIELSHIQFNSLLS